MRDLEMWPSVFIKGRQPLFTQKPLHPPWFRPLLLTLNQVFLEKRVVFLLDSSFLLSTRQYNRGGAAYCSIFITINVMAHEGIPLFSLLLDPPDPKAPLLQ